MRKGRENLENTKEAVEEYEKEYRRNMKDVRRQEKKKEHFREGNYQEDSQ